MVACESGFYRACIGCAALIAAAALPAMPAQADAFSVIEELLVPGGPAGEDGAPVITGSSQLSSHSFRFSGRSEAEGGGPPIQNVVPLQALGLPQGFGLVIDQTSEVPAFEGVTFQMSDWVRFDATWDFGSEPGSVEGFVDLHLSF
ncbi:MAG: hypothetical protein AAFV19_23655 [Pseudomonadota bacterium]